MKAALRSIVLLTVFLTALPADVLHLRDGRTIAGYYAGGTQKELWFQSNGVSAEAYPTLMVESLQFGVVTGTIPLGYSKPDPGSGTPGLEDRQRTASAQPWDGRPGLLVRTRAYLSRLYLTTILATAWFS